MNLDAVKLWPRSLTGQMAMLVAAALFLAQAINFMMLLQERRSLRFAQTIGPASARLLDAAERLADPRRRERARLPGWVKLAPASPLRADAQRQPEVERALADAFRDAGIPAGRIEAGVGRVVRGDPVLADVGPRRARRMIREGSQLIIAVEQPGDRWLVLRAAWQRTERGLIWRLLGQTLVLYIVVLLPVLWIARRIARPLRALTAAAREFGRGADGEPVPETGPRDLRALVAAFNALQLRVGAMLDEKDRMLGAIGHDLRTPLAALRVRIESVEDEGDRAKMADTIDEMSRTLDDILSLARLGRPSEPLTEVDLSALLDAVVEDFRDLGAAVTMVEAPRTPLRVRPALMRRAVRNLIENAVKYGGGAETSLIVTPRDIRICVADRGPGIPPERLAEAFDPFTRLEASRNRETGGSGLGLALARAIVRDAGGEITLTNRDGGGLLAEIVLPR